MPLFSGRLCHLALPASGAADHTLFRSIAGSAEHVTTPQLRSTYPLAGGRSSRRRKKQPGAALVRRWVMPFLTVIAVLVLSVALVLTIYYTLLELQWIAFLLGVLFAAVLSMVTQTVKVQWRLVRRDAQLRRSKELLAEEVARTERGAQVLKMAELRHRTVLDGLPLMVFFVDREERCRHYNRAFQEWCGDGSADLAGLPLKDLFDGDAYTALSSGGREALLGAARSSTRRDGRAPTATATSSSS